jgi:ribonuclease H / adenosylcobalamin/alpha-ribazole phosphatase
MSARWPATLWIIRHGESAGNIASRETQPGDHRFRLDMRDADIPLSPTGEHQASALGHWFASGKVHAKPDFILSSPYLRAIETARLFHAAGGAHSKTPILTDERLREKECGILDGLTPDGVAHFHPDQSAQRKLLGKFYHRPPGGENWCDVILRLRSLLNRISIHHSGEHVMIVAHEVVVFCLRYIIENLDEAAIMAIDASGDVANCAITEYRFDVKAADGNGGLIRTRWAETIGVTSHGAKITEASDKIVAARG